MSKSRQRPKPTSRIRSNAADDQRMMVCGIHPIEESLLAIDAQTASGAKLYLAESRRPKELEKILKVSKRLDLIPQVLNTKDLDSIAQGVRHQGAILELPPFTYHESADIYELKPKSRYPFILVLDQIQDPHNLGAIIRSAVAFEVDAIVIPKDRSALITSTSLKTSAGLAYRIPIVLIGNLAQFLNEISKSHFQILGAEMTGNSHRNVSWEQATALVMGSESEGLRRLTREKCHELIKIDHSSQVESLNVSVASAIFLHTAYEQRFSNS